MSIVTRPKFRKMTILVCGALLFSATLAVAQDRCSTILQDGLWEFRQTADYNRQTSSFLSWFCSQQFENFQSAKESGGKVGIPIEGIPVEIGGFHREKNWKSYAQSACSLRAGNYEQVSMFSGFARQASGVIAEAWSKCVASPGFYGLVTYFDDPTQFALGLHYVGMDPNDKATVTDLIVRPADVKCDPVVTADRPAVIRSSLEKNFLCTRPKDKPVTIVLNGDRKLMPASTFNVRVVKSSDPALYREIVSEKIAGRGALNSETIVIKSGANIEVVPTDGDMSLVVAAKRLVVEGPFSINGKGAKGKDGPPQTACAVGGCQWTSGPDNDHSRCHDAWIKAGGHPDDKGQRGHAGGVGGKGALVVFRYETIEGNTGDGQCNVAGGDGGPGGTGGAGRTLVNCSNPGNLRKSGPAGDRGPDGPQGPTGECKWEQVKR
jgi:hypothetical protein